jgi:hypothetical protein
LSVVGSNVVVMDEVPGDQQPADAAARPALLEGLAAIGRIVDEVSGANAWSLSDEQAREGVRECFELLARVESVWLGLVRDLDSREGAVAGARPGKAAHSFLTQALHVSPGKAAADVAAAHALDPDAAPGEGRLPAMGAAFAAGQVSRGHVDVAVRTLARIPRHLARGRGPDGVSGAERVDAFLTEQSRHLSPGQTGQLARHLLGVLDPEGSDRFDPLAHERRSLTMGRDATGMRIGRFQLAPAGGARLKAALDHFAAPSPAAAGWDERGQQVLIPDRRTREQRYADALVALADAALSATPSGTAEPADVLVIATPEQLAAARAAARAAHPDPGGPQPGDPHAGDPLPADAQPGAPQPGAGEDTAAAPGLATCTRIGPLTPTTLGLLGCDAAFQAIILTRSGPGTAPRVLDLGRTVRTVTRAQRRALIARDLGCVVPGCAAPPQACQAHHVTYWRHGGATDLANLALVCHRHHTEIHLGTWQLRMCQGTPWAIPPPWIDPDRRPLRNTAHHAADDARRLGQQLRLDLDDSG